MFTPNPSQNVSTFETFWTEVWCKLRSNLLLFFSRNWRRAVSFWQINQTVKCNIRYFDCTTPSCTTFCISAQTRHLFSWGKWGVWWDEFTGKKNRELKLGIINQSSSPQPACCSSSGQASDWTPPCSKDSCTSPSAPPACPRKPPDSFCSSCVHSLKTRGPSACPHTPSSRTEAPLDVACRPC